MNRPVDMKELRRLPPMSSLKKEKLHALSKKVKVRGAQPGEALFNEGDSEKRTVYVLTGTVQLREAGRAIGTIVGGSEEAVNPLAPVLPRRCAAVALTPCEYIAIDSDLLVVMLTWDQAGQYEVSVLRGEANTPDD